MKLAEFLSYRTKQMTHIVYHEQILMDQYTPLELYGLLHPSPFTFLLESADIASAGGRYSIIGFKANERISFEGGCVTHTVGLKKNTYDTNNPILWIQNFWQEKKARLAIPHSLQEQRFCGGLVGYFGYDVVFSFEKHLKKIKKKDPTAIPELQFIVCNHFIVFDTWRHTSTICIIVPITSIGFAQARKEIDTLLKIINQKKTKQAIRINPSIFSKAISSKDYFPSSQFKRQVKSLITEITNGVAMQIVLSRLINVKTKASSFLLYRMLRLQNPSPYLYIIRFSEFDLIGSSPELLVSLDQDKQATIKPVAGTRARGATPQEDESQGQELISDAKERAEHTMLIDLGRNDLGKVCLLGSLRLDDVMSVERFASVMHMTSTITGKLKPSIGPLDLFKAIFPAGTLSGAPKIKAMQIIEDIEPTRRGAYGGATGYLSYNGVLDMAITIRSIVKKGNQLFLQTGAGIVYDSVPQNEFLECEKKANATLRAIYGAQQIKTK
ncbi:MAG: anthranilate synthase component I family protein [Methylacidiphilales bacterium]|nr:anthranilate synthase component I family protein [Candidatus Methylacidiphilales bacterium]